MSQISEIQVYTISREEAYKIKTEEQIIALEVGFYIEKVKNSDDAFLITDDINRKYLLVKGKNFEEKVLKADEEFFTEIEKELKINDKYEIQQNVDGINIFSPGFIAVEKTEGVRYKYTEKSGIPYKKRGRYICAVIPYEFYISSLYEKLFK